MIPRTFHQVWLGSWPMPLEHQEYSKAWLELHPGWTYRLWTDEDATPELLGPNADVYARAEELVPAHGIWPFRADILRYAILLRFGGVYVDTDFQPLRSLEPLLPGIDCFAAWESTGKWINNAIVGAVPSYPFLADLVANLAGHVLEHADPENGVRANKLTGPQYLTKVYNQVGNHRLVHVFPKAWFYPYLWNELGRGREAFPGAYAVHHWTNMRKRKEKPL